MNLYSEIVRDTSINPVKQIGDLPARQCHSGGASLFHRANMVSTPKYHPLPACSRPTEGLAGFFLPSAGSRTGIEGEKDISDTRISDSFRRPCLPALILREQTGQQFLHNKNNESFSKIESDSHWTTLV